MLDPRKQLGNTAEAVAATYLKEKGYRVLARQFRKTFGEIDLVCQDGNEVVFVEVKARASSDYGYPEEAVTEKKIGHLVQVGEAYLAQKHLEELPWRIDVVSVEYKTSPPTVTHIEDIDIPEKFW